MACKWCMLPCSQRAVILFQTRGKFRHDCRHGVSVHCMCVQILSLYATGWPVLPSCMQLTLVGWYVASMLCCHCWVFSLSDALPMQSYPSKVWVLCQCGRADLCAAQLICFLPIYFSTWNRWYIMANTLKMLTSWLSNIHLNGWIYGLVPSADCKLWDMLFLFWSSFCMAESWPRRLSLC